HSSFAPSSKEYGAIFKRFFHTLQSSNKKQALLALDFFDPFFQSFAFQIPDRYLEAIHPTLEELALFLRNHLEHPKKDLQSRYKATYLAFLNFWKKYENSSMGKELYLKEVQAAFSFYFRLLQESKVKNLNQRLQEFLEFLETIIEIPVDKDPILNQSLSFLTKLFSPSDPDSQTSDLTCLALKAYGVLLSKIRSPGQVEAEEIFHTLSLVERFLFDSKKEIRFAAFQAYLEGVKYASRFFSTFLEKIEKIINLFLGYTFFLFLAKEQDYASSFKNFLQDISVLESKTAFINRTSLILRKLIWGDISCFQKIWKDLAPITNPFFRSEIDKLTERVTLFEDFFEETESKDKEPTPSLFAVIALHFYEVLLLEFYPQKELASWIQHEFSIIGEWLLSRIHGRYKNIRVWKSEVFWDQLEKIYLLLLFGIMNGPGFRKNHVPKMMEILKKLAQREDHPYQDTLKKLFPSIAKKYLSQNPKTALQEGNLLLQEIWEKLKPRYDENQKEDPFLTDLLWVEDLSLNSLEEFKSYDIECYSQLSGFLFPSPHLFFKETKNIRGFLERFLSEESR
ncbi:MAG: hypothetical protein D6785_11690, partial [Planctomycetota bacterium]